MEMIPSREEHAWLAAFGAAAVFIACTAAGSPCAIGTAQDLSKALAAQRHALGRDTQLARMWWISSPAAALELTRSIKLAPGATVEEAERRIRESARRLGTPLAEHGPTLERARAALAKLDRGLKLAQSRGVL
jgi:hypothetical protein